MRELVKIGIGASWSGDNRWLYYALNSDRLQCIQNLHASVADVDSDIMLLDGLLR